MKCPVASSTRFSNGAINSVCLFVLFATVSVSQRCAYAADEFQDLVNQIPRTANSVVLLNMEKLKNSPLGVKEEWKSKIERAFGAGMIRVPPQATRFVLAAEMDFDSFEPTWEVAVMDLDTELSLETMANARGGTMDTIDGLQAVSLPSNTYLVQLGPKTLGAMAPANRQAVARWIREVRKSPPPPLSPYLQKAAVYSDEAGSEIIMALDLEGVMSFARVGKYLKAHQKQMDEWHAEVAPTASLLSAMRGVRIGIRIGEQPSGKIAVDLQSFAEPIASFAKPLLLQVLADRGELIEDFQSWTEQVRGREMSLAGSLSTSGLRRLLSVIESPVRGDLAATKKPSPSQASPGEQLAIEAEKQREFFRTILAMANDLKGDMKNAKNLASTQLFFDKYARRIERMPILGIDDELIDYGAFVANALRQATGSVKTMGIQTGVRSAQITGGSGGDYGYGYGGYSYGYSEVKDVGSQRRVVRAEEKAVMATDVQGLRQQIISTTADMRRKMTKKYQVEF